MKNKRIHLIGIGGVSMSSIALLLKSLGNEVTGSDRTESPIIDNLRKNNINVFIGTNKNIIKDTDIVIYTMAIDQNNEELLEAKKLNKIIYSRPEFIHELSKNYKNVLCISGTHGKSTTTGMTSKVFLDCGVNPTIMVGAYLKDIDGYLHIGKEDYLILETCEYKDAFLSFLPTTSVILNIDDDHLDYFKNLDNIKKSFQKFANLTKDYLILNNDDNNSKDIKHDKIITYGINNSSNIEARNIKKDQMGHPIFDVYYNNEYLTTINLNVFGTHNIYNSLATIAFSIIYNLDITKVTNSLNTYSGVKRRFEFIGTYNNAYLIDDYAHHPTEIKSTLESSKQVNANKTIAVFQAHTYSRTKEHLKEFANVLAKFDEIIIAPIFPAREENIYNIHESDLVDLIKKENPNVIYLDSFSKIEDYLKTHIEPNNLVISIGAGPINKVMEGIKEC